MDMKETGMCYTEYENGNHLVGRVLEQCGYVNADACYGSAFLCGNGFVLNRSLYFLSFKTHLNRSCLTDAFNA